MKSDASKITRHATEILKKNPILLIPAALQALLNQAIFLTLLYPIASNLDQARLLLSLTKPSPIKEYTPFLSFLLMGFLLFLLVDSFFDSLLLGMIKDCWRRGHAKIKLDYASTYFPQMLGVKFLRYLILSTIMLASLLPMLLLMSGSPLLGALTAIGVATIFFIALFSLYWVKEASVADHKGIASALRSSYHLTRRKPKLVIYIIAIMLFLVVLSQSILNLVSFLPLPEAAITVTITSISLGATLLIALVNLTLKMSAFLQCRKYTE